MDIRRMKVWMLSAPPNGSLPHEHSEAPPDCLCLPVNGMDNPAEQVRNLRGLRPDTPLFLICESISEACNISAFTDAAASAPDGIILRGVESAARLQMAETLLRVAEARANLREGSIALIAMIGDNASGLLNAGQFVHRPGRLIAIGYAAETLTDVDCDDETVRYGAIATMLAARRLGIPAIDFTSTEKADSAFETACQHSAKSGFTGKLAAQPIHIGMIKQAFSAA